jgi:hypothetical protein
MELSNRPLAQRGFRGYRYVTSEETREFESGFTRARGKGVARGRPVTDYEGVVRRIIADVPVRDPVLRRA